jgi:hypothetical protein
MLFLNAVAGIIDAIISRILEGLASQVATCLSGTKAASLALRPDLALLMATEPDALLLPASSSSTAELLQLQHHQQQQQQAAAFYIPGALYTSSSGVEGGGLPGETQGLGAADGSGFGAWAQAAVFNMAGFMTALKSTGTYVFLF